MRVAQQKRALADMARPWDDEPAEKPEEKPFLFSSEPITAYRCFRWGACEDPGSLFDLCAVAPAGENPFAWARKDRLMSGAYSTVWPEYQAMHARCEGRSHQVAAWGCGCGLWGVKTKELARSYSGQYGASIVAEVALWGHFTEHSRGWRAEYGYPQRLFVLEPFQFTASGWQEADYAEFAARLADQYGIPAETWKKGPPKPETRNYTSISAATASTSAYSYTMTTPTYSSVPVAPAPIWPSTIVHPSQLYPTIVLGKQIAVYKEDLPF